MHLLIDYREKDFIKLFEDTVKDLDISYKVMSLPVGDFILLEDTEDYDTIKLVIERKSIRDLSSSITDGRFREQKQRLLESVKDCDKICYLLEGNKNLLDNFVLSNTIINSSILNLIFRHKYNVVQTENIKDSSNMILMLYKKFKADEFQNSQNANSKNIKLIKRSDKIIGNKLLHQLTLIPGVSQNIANTIINLEYKNIKDLINKYNTLENDSQREMLFADIIISDNGVKKRRIGKALSKKIYEYFYC